MLKVVVEFCGMQLKNRKGTMFYSDWAEGKGEIFSKKAEKKIFVWKEFCKCDIILP